LVIVLSLSIYGNSKILSTLQAGAGNKRALEMSLKKGQLKIDGVGDKIFFEIESSYAYSEPGQEIPFGELVVKTEEIGADYLVTLTSNLSHYDLTFDGEDKLEVLHKAATPYKIFFTNKGKDVVDMPEESCNEDANSCDPGIIVDCSAFDIPENAPQAEVSYVTIDVDEATGEATSIQAVHKIIDI